LYIQILNDVDVVQLQLAVDALVQWATIWQLTVSVNKCCVLNISKITHNTSLSIIGATLPVVESARDLGILVSHDLSVTLLTHQ